MNILNNREIKVNDITIKWFTEKGTCTFEDLPVAMMWIDTTLAGLMSGLEHMVGPKRFNLALQSEGRKSVEADWEVFRNYTHFKDGFKAIANIAAVAGWGHWTLLSIDEQKKECIFQVEDSWEGLYQKALGACWGSGMVAGKMAGYCSKHFKTNCWAEQTKFIANGDQYDEFVVNPSARSIEEEIEKLLTTDEATKADMAVALNKLKNEIKERTIAQTKLKKSEKRYKEAYDRAELYKDLFAHDISNLLQGILTSNQLVEILLNNTASSQHIREILKTIKEQVERGSNLIFNVRKLSQIEEHERALEKIEIINILKKCIALLKKTFSERKIEINIKTFKEKIYVKADKLIEDVFDNLLINAVKHNMNPTIEITIIFSEVKIENLSYYQIEFIDNGKGIEDVRKKSIFQRLSGEIRSVSGMGLGLSLVKKIIDSYKGKIWVENRIQNDHTQGSKFIILIPEII